MKNVQDGRRRQLLQPRRPTRQEATQQAVRLLQREQGWDGRCCSPQRPHALPAVPGAVNGSAGMSAAIGRIMSRKHQAIPLDQRSSEEEVALVKAIVRREGLLANLHSAVLEFKRGFAHNKRKLRSDGRAVLDKLSQLRAVSVCVVEAVSKWRSLGGARFAPFEWKGRNYLVKMSQDLNFLSEMPELVQILRVEPRKLRHNPLMLPQTLLETLEQAEAETEWVKQRGGATHTTTDGKDQEKEKDKARLQAAERILVEELRRCGLSGFDKECSVASCSKLTESPSTSTPKRSASLATLTHISPAETDQLLEWLSFTPPYLVHSLRSIWRTDVRSPGSRSRPGSEGFHTRPARRNRPQSSPPPSRHRSDSAFAVPKVLTATWSIALSTPTAMQAPCRCLIVHVCSASR